jgi:hypothetical protein
MFSHIEERERGFSTVTFIITLCLIIFVGLVGWSEFISWQQRSADMHDKASANAINAYLENVYYPAHKAYPAGLTDKVLEGIVPSQRIDSGGHMLGSQASSVRYEPSSCLGGSCKYYVVRTLLTSEADYQLTSKVVH